MVKEAWVNEISLPIKGSVSPTSVQFVDAIKDEPDFFLLAGYVPATS